MKILHTSDWHLGRLLYGRKRYEEFSKFLDWLAELIHSEGVDALLIAGDIFDTTTPSNSVQELYYRFLFRVSASCCRHVVVIAGNHDSPSFLGAPKELLRTLNVHVVASITERPADEVVELTGKDGGVQAIVCAVPYLRDRDIRTSEAGESSDAKNSKLIEGIKNHYADVCRIADEMRKSHERHCSSGRIPVIATGHLFAAGGKSVDGDGVRELYVGSLAHVRRDVFPGCLDYVALGHLHVAQKVGGDGAVRYSGSPIPMGFGEAGQVKKIIFIEFADDEPRITEYAVPCFQKLERITGGMDEITERIDTLKRLESDAWLEIEYTGEEIAPNLRELVETAVSGSGMEIRRIRNKKVTERMISRTSEEETLDELDVNDVFIRALDASDVSEEQRAGLVRSYKMILQEILEEDVNEE